MRVVTVWLCRYGIALPPNIVLEPGIVADGFKSKGLAMRALVGPILGLPIPVVAENSMNLDKVCVCVGLRRYL